MEATQPIVIDENRQAVVGELMRNVYIWMTAGLAITGIVAWLVSSSPAALSLIFGNQVIFWGMLIAELVLVLVLSAAIQKLSFFAWLSSARLFTKTSVVSVRSSSSR